MAFGLSAWLLVAAVVGTGCTDSHGIQEKRARFGGAKAIKHSTSVEISSSGAAKVQPVQGVSVRKRNRNKEASKKSQDIQFPGEIHGGKETHSAGLAADVRSRKDSRISTDQAKYVSGEVNTNTCPGGYSRIPSQDECVIARGTLTGETSTGGVLLRDFASYPTGCFTYGVHWYYNVHAGGSAGGAAPVCVLQAINEDAGSDDDYLDFPELPEPEAYYYSSESSEALRLEAQDSPEDDYSFPLASDGYSSSSYNSGYAGDDYSGSSGGSGSSGSSGSAGDDYSGGPLRAPAETKRTRNTMVRVGVEGGSASLVVGSLSWATFALVMM